MKQSATCKNTLNKAEFYNDFTSKDTLLFKCKTCTKLRNILLSEQYKIKNINTIYPEDFHKICCYCKQNKFFTECHKRINFKSGLDSYCKQCKYEILLNNINSLLKQRLRTSIYHLIKNINQPKHIINLLCCDTDF